MIHKMLYRLDLPPCLRVGHVRTRGRRIQPMRWGFGHLRTATRAACHPPWKLGMVDGHLRTGSRVVDRESRLSTGLFVRLIGHLRTVHRACSYALIGRVRTRDRASSYDSPGLFVRFARAHLLKHLRHHWVTRSAPSPQVLAGTLDQEIRAANLRNCPARRRPAGCRAARAMDRPAGFATDTLRVPTANGPCGPALRVHRPAHTPGLRLDTLRVPTALDGADAVPTRPGATINQVSSRSMESRSPETQSRTRGQ
jgi:hypothetical protein